MMDAKDKEIQDLRNALETAQSCGKGNLRAYEQCRMHAARLQRALDQVGRTACRWKPVKHNPGLWDTECGAYWRFASLRGVIFCPRCRGRVEESF